MIDIWNNDLLMKDLNPHRIIVRMPNWIGDLVMATPVLADLRKRFPESEITALCRFPGCSLLEQDNNINELFCFQKRRWGFQRRRECRNIIEKLHNGKYDVGILLTNSFSSAWLFYQGNMKVRIGYKRGFRSFFLTHPVSFPQKIMHQEDLYKKLLEPLGIAHSKTPPKLYVTKEEQIQVKELLQKRGWDGQKKLIGLCPGAAYGLAKCWPLDRYEKLAKTFVEKGYMVAFFGDTTLFSASKDMCTRLPAEILNLVGSTTLREFMCTLSFCSLVVVNDSGPMHIASAMNIPLIALFGSTDRRKTGPHQGHVIDKQEECSPCFERKCPIDFRCMKNISVAEVFRKAQEILCSKN